MSVSGSCGSCAGVMTPTFRLDFEVRRVLVNRACSPMVTLARMVFDGPVLMKRKKIARKTQSQAKGNGACIIRMMKMVEMRMPLAETMKYAPEV